MPSLSSLKRTRRDNSSKQLVELPPLDARKRAEALQEIGAAEIMLAPESKLIGKPLGDLDFRSRYRLSVLAIRRRGEALTTNLVNQTLDFGDTLLIAGDWADIGKLWDDREDFVVLTLPAEYQERLPARQRAPVAIIILIAMVVVMAFGLIPNSAAALLAALAMIVGGCVRLDAIYRIISWKTVVLIAGMLPLATALTKTGATDLMAKELVAALGSLGPMRARRRRGMEGAIGKRLSHRYRASIYRQRGDAHVTPFAVSTSVRANHWQRSVSRAELFRRFVITENMPSRARSATVTPEICLPSGAPHQ
jgi:hypothetical protein